MNEVKKEGAAVTGQVENPVVVMKRYELKYTLTEKTADYLRRSLEGRMEVDRFGKTSIASLYYDTPSYQLIRTSMEKPLFKEKIRLRSYGLATDRSPVYLELKRKAYGIVYKRRVQTTIPLVKKFLDGDGDICAPGQINREITAFRDHYRELAPACLIIYDRTAYFEPGGDLRLTIDENPRYRMEDLRLDRDMEGESLLPPGGAILELKVQDAMPLWLTQILSQGGLRKDSFSKYGAAYARSVLERRKESIHV